MTPEEPPTSTDIDTVDNTAELVADDRLRPLVAAWLLSFKSPHTVRNYRHDLAPGLDQGLRGAHVGHLAPSAAGSLRRSGWRPG